MRPILTPKQISESLLRNVKRKVADAVIKAKEAAVAKARDLSPRPNSPYADHPYATGAYRDSWVWKGNRLVNVVEHAKYTDDGYTRYGGKRSAKPWITRGSVKYSDQIAIAVAEVLRQALGGRGRAK